MAGSRTAPESGSLLERWDQRGLAIACVVAVGGSAAAALFGLSAAWQMPFLFTALYAVLRALVPLTESRRELAGLRTEVESLRRDFDQVNSSRIEHYPDATAFYQAEIDYLRNRRPSHMDAWYMRLETPDDFSASTPAFSEYFRAVLDWADNGGSVRRLFCLGSPRGYAGWTAQHREDTHHLRSYSIREVTWPIKADLMSMAIMDTSAVFLAFTVGDRVQGMRIEDSEAAAYFKSYFDRHWENAREVPRAPAR
ncbi:hypothetical protein AQJ67_27220 [Streptomyces caeruleatus]|uniref:Uncharacterized protein n=2 Tax=Streptomyces caeruleatus TaxID=661399 RepID=A0A101TTZ5_9ACTN|nr:hypothetical protein AQJ67_27220 [Streptomyces caeruleatus]